MATIPGTELNNNTSNNTILNSLDPNFQILSNTESLLLTPYPIGQIMHDMSLYESPNPSTFIDDQIEMNDVNSSTLSPSAVPCATQINKEFTACNFNLLRSNEEQNNQRCNSSSRPQTPFPAPAANSYQQLK